MEKNQFTFTGVIVGEETGYSSLCLELDVASQGISVDDAKKNLLEVVSLYIELALEANLPIIRPVPAEENPLTARAGDVAETFNIKIDLRVGQKNQSALTFSKKGGE